MPLLLLRGAGSGPRTPRNRATQVRAALTKKKVWYKFSAHVTLVRQRHSQPMGSRWFNVGESVDEQGI